MRILQTKSLLVLLLANALVVGGQTRRFTRDDLEFVVELPPAWRVVTRVDVYEHPEFTNRNNPLNGYLRLRKVLVARSTSASELFQQQEKWELKRLPGYLVCGECDGVEFNGDFPARVFAYEFVSAGRGMYGRIYYLQIDQYTFYSLHFTVARELLPAITGDMDSIVRSFRLKDRWMGQICRSVCN